MILNITLSLVLTILFFVLAIGLIWLLVNAFTTVIMLLGFFSVFIIAYSFVDNMRNG